MPRELQLNGNFDEATEDDEPHQNEAGFGTNNGGRDQFPGTHNGCRKNEARPQILQAVSEGLKAVPSPSFRAGHRDPVGLRRSLQNRSCELLFPMESDQAAKRIGVTLLITLVEQRCSRDGRNRSTRSPGSRPSANHSWHEHELFRLREYRSSEPFTTPQTFSDY